MGERKDQKESVWVRKKENYTGLATSDKGGVSIFAEGRRKNQKRRGYKWSERWRNTPERESKGAENG